MSDDRPVEPEPPRRYPIPGGPKGLIQTDDFYRQLAKWFRREGDNLLINTNAFIQRCDGYLFNREQTEELIDHLREIADKLPTLDQRLDGLTVCRFCEGERVMHDVERATESDCPNCGGEGLVKKTWDGFQI